MKSRIFMYLFIFSVLLIIFQYVNSKNILDDYEQKITKCETKTTQYKDSISNLQDKIFNLSNFNIEGNEEALSYFESLGYRVDELIPAIHDELYKMNAHKGEDHPIVPYASMTDNKMLINEIRIINHKWIIANFTDGKHWGELFINYSIDENNNLKYTLTDYFMYPIHTY